MNKYKISYLIFISFWVFTSFTLSAQNKVEFFISDGLYDEGLKAKIETTISDLLTEANTAQSNKKALNLERLNISEDAKESLTMLWENIPFRCIDTEVVEHCLQNGSDYQIRNIPLMLIPQEEGVESEYQEAVISFDSNGQITSLYLTLAGNMYAKVMKTGSEVTDLRRRQLILDYVEQFRTAYNTKDINFLRQVFSDDALIITGKVIDKLQDGKSVKQVTYKSQSKNQYLTNLGNAFKVQKYIKVNFSDIKVTQGAKKNYYGVLVQQAWRSGTYSDDGYVFLLWDFENEDRPQIHVRTWQPEYLDKAKTQKIEEDDIFSLADFDLP